LNGLRAGEWKILRSGRRKKMQEKSKLAPFAKSAKGCSTQESHRVAGATPTRPVAARLPLDGRLRIVKNRANSMNLERLNRITVEAGKCGGRPCIRGQRIRVTDVLELLSAGASIEEILRDYPSLEREDILAALDYAAHQTDHVVLPAS